MPPPPSQDHLDLPARIIWAGDHPVVELRRIGADALQAAFWDDACAGARVTALAALDDQPAPIGQAPLQGGIFHTYRCGSTLLCRQLSALPGVYALAEPDFLSQLVLRKGQTPALLRARLLKVLALMAGGLGPRGARIVVKWPGLLADQAALLIQALPDVPMLFLHRDPVEVLASIERRPLGNIGGAAAALGLEHQQWTGSEAAQAAQVIAWLCRRIAAAGGIRHCDYHGLDPVAIARYFGLAVDQPGQAAMAQAGTWYSKGLPGHARFGGDSAQKRAEASAEVHHLAAQVLGPALALVLARLPQL